MTIYDVTEAVATETLVCLNGRSTTICVCAAYARHYATAVADDVTALRACCSKFRAAAKINTCFVRPQNEIEKSTLFLFSVCFSIRL